MLLNGDQDWHRPKPDTTLTDEEVAQELRRAANIYIVMSFAIHLNAMRRSWR